MNPLIFTELHRANPFLGNRPIVFAKVLATLVYNRKDVEEVVLNIRTEDDWRHFFTRMDACDLSLEEEERLGWTAPLSLVIEEGVETSDVFIGLLDFFRFGQKSYFAYSLHDEVRRLGDAWTGASSDRRRHYYGAWPALLSAAAAVRNGQAARLLTNAACLQWARIASIFVKGDLTFDVWPFERYGFGDLPKDHAAVILPAFGLRLQTEGPFRETEIAALYDALQTKGRIALCASAGLLFRSTGEAMEIKKKLLGSRRLRAVVLLEGGLYSPAVNTSTVFLLLDDASKRHDTVRMMRLAPHSRRTPWANRDPEDIIARLEAPRALDDATTDEADVPVETLLEKGCNLTPTFYLRSAEDTRFFRAAQKRETVRLGDVAEVIRGMPLFRERDAVGEEEEDISPYREVSPGDMNEYGFLETPKRTVHPKSPDDLLLPKFRRQKLQKGDIVMAVRGRDRRVGITALVEDIPPGETWFFGQLCIVLRLKPRSAISDPVYLLRYLQSSTVFAQIQKLVSGTMLGQIKPADVENLVVALPKHKKQIATVRRHFDERKEKAAEIARLQAELVATKSEDDWIDL